MKIFLNKVIRVKVPLTRLIYVNGTLTDKTKLGRRRNEL